MSQAIKYESTTVEPEQSAAEIMQLVEAMRDLRHRAGHFEAIARRALELLESGEWQEPEGPLRPRNHLRVRGSR